MIPDQELQQVSRLDHGKTYFRFGGGMRPLIFTVNDSGQKERLADCVYFGPIDTTPSVIDLSHFDLSKIEPKKQPDKPGVWHCSNRLDGHPDLTQFVSRELMSDGRKWMHAEYRYLCDFIPPRQSPVIPPLPTVTLYAVEQLGVVKWCHKSNCGFWTADGLQAFGDPGAVPIAEEVVTVTE